MKKHIQELLIASTLVLAVFVLMFTSFTNKKNVEYTMVEEHEEVLQEVEVPLMEKETTKENKVVIERVNVQLRQRLAVVAMKFAEDMKYPPYSQPLSKNRGDLLHPNAFYPTRLKLDEGLSTTIKLSKYQYFKPEVITLSLSIHANKNVNNYNLDSLVILSNQKEVAKLNFLQDKKDANNIYYTASYEANKNEVKTWADKLYVRATFVDKDKTVYSAATSFEYVNKEAELLSVKKAFIDENELIIPLVLDTYSEGKYLVKANLFDESLEPIAHLYTQVKLQEGQQELYLKAHASTLRYKNAAGPYILKNITIIKLITEIQGKRGYGQSPKLSYKVNGFELQRYSDEPYYNENAQEKLAFLQKISK